MSKIRFVHNFAKTLQKAGVDTVCACLITHSCENVKIVYPKDSVLYIMRKSLL